MTTVNSGPRPEELMTQGFSAYQNGRAEDAERAFAAAVKQDPTLGDGWYYLGLLAYARKDWLEAETNLRRAITLGASVVNAQHYLGLLPGAKPPSDGATPPELDLTTSPYGLYEALSRSTDPLLRQPLELIDALRMTRHASVTAFLHRFLGAAGVAFLAGYVIAQGRQSLRYAGETSDRATATVLGITGLALAIAAVAWIWIALVALTTRYVIDRGRLQITTGVLNRRTRNLELYRVTDVVLVRTLIQRLTGDGALHLHAIRVGAEKEEVFDLTGVARTGELEVVFQQLLNLIFALRANPYCRGIIS